MNNPGCGFIVFAGLLLFAIFILALSVAQIDTGCYAAQGYRQAYGAPGSLSDKITKASPGYALGYAWCKP